MRFRTTVAAFALTTAAISPLRAQGFIDGVRAAGVVRERTAVTVQVKNQIATVEVEEWFRNRGAGLGEGDYLYPLPAGATFSSYSLFQGDQELKGEMLKAGEARRIYEAIVRRRQDPALIELVGHGLVRARVFPIAAGESRRVVLRYTQVLQRAGDALEFRYGGRRSDAGAPTTLSLTVDNAAAFRDAVSATHTLSVKRASGRMTVRPAEKISSELSVLLPYAERAVGISLSTHRGASSEDGYFMLRLSPGDVTAASRVPRDVTVVVDVSGSMSGEKMTQAKAALRQLLGTLGPADRFRLIRFSSMVDAWRDGWTRATADDLRAALRWVDALNAEGGTNISGALAEAFSLTSPSSRLGVVVFLTDGLPSVGEQNPERIAAIAERDAGRTRVFAFGVGHDVNTHLLDRLGAAGRGGAQYVEPGESVETALGTLATRIEFPVLTDLALDASGVTLREIYPVKLPDLFAGEDLVLFGRYRNASRFGSVLTVRGERAGKAESYSTRTSFSTREGGNEYIAKLWATRKLGELTRRVALEGRNSELIEEIRATALRYGLLSEYTSYFVAEPGAPILAQTGNGVLSRDLAATGSGAVARAEAARVRRDASSTSQVAAAEKAAEARLADRVAVAPAAPPVVRGTGTGTGTGTATGTGTGTATGSVAGDARAAAPRIVAGRTFRLTNGLWVDDAADRKVRTLDIAPFSDAYFAVLSALPELKPYVTELKTVAVSGRLVTIRFTKGGIATLAAADVANTVAQFRSAVRDK